MDDHHPDTDDQEPLVVGLSFFDLLFIIDEHLDQFSNALRHKGSQLKHDLHKRTQNLRRIVDSDPFLNSKNPAASSSASFSSPSSAAERELRNLKAKFHSRLSKFVLKWNDAKAVSTREKINFFTGVMNIVLTCLMVGFRPHWIPYAFTAQFLFFMPIRYFSYKKALYHYFLLDMCYVINLMCFLFLWILPFSDLWFEATYALSMGPVASAILTWRNSLVFHSIDKFTSLYIHIYPPLTLTVIRHFYPHAERDYPALAKLPYLKAKRTIFVASLVYLIWQLLYYRFIIIARRDKIEKQGRVTSFTYMLQNRKSFIGKTLAKIPPQHREWSFMLSQFLYTVITMIPPVLWLYSSSFLSATYLLVCFAISAWNGATFQIEIFGKRFEKEFNALCKELEELQRQNQSSSISPQSISPLSTSPNLTAVDSQKQPQPQQQQQQSHLSSSASTVSYSHSTATSFDNSSPSTSPLLLRTSRSSHSHSHESMNET